VTKKEREAENRRLAQLAAMEEQGVWLIGLGSGVGGTSTRSGWG